MGGRITTGSDSGFIYQPYGFGYIMELELLHEAGLEPLEVIKAATLNGAKTLYEPKGIEKPPIGTVNAESLRILSSFPKTLWGTCPSIHWPVAEAVSRPSTATVICA
jgi:hypothetical protein